MQSSNLNVTFGQNNKAPCKTDGAWTTICMTIHKHSSEIENNIDVQKFHGVIGSVMTLLSSLYVRVSSEMLSLILLRSHWVLQQEGLWSPSLC